MRSLEEYLREQAARSTLPHDVLERLMRSLMGIVERRCELRRSSEAQLGRDVLRALGVMSLLEVQEWTWLMQVVEGERVEAILVYGAREYAHLERSTQSELVKVDVYASYGKSLSDTSAEMREWYSWLQQFRDAMQRHAPAGAFARASRAPGGLGVPITTILLGSRASSEEWRGVETLTSWTQSEAWLFRTISSPDTAYLEERVTEYPQDRVIQKRYWRVDLRALREEPAT